MAARQLWVAKYGSNSNSGSASSPLKTIQAAVNRASNGTEIKVKAGTYTENISIKKDGIELVSADGQYAAKIKPASHSQGTIYGFGRENVEIRDFDITAPSKANGIHFSQAGRNFTDLAKNLTIVGNKVHGAGDDGIKISQANNVKIIGNKITDSGEQGIDFVAVNGSTIANNTVADARGPSALMVKGGSTNVTIDNNKVYDAKVFGISVGGWTSEQFMRPGTKHYEAKNLKVTNNDVWDTGKAALLVSGAHNSYIADNVLDANKSYFTVVLLDRSSGTHRTPIYSKDTTIEDNTLARSSWLRVNKGNGSGLDVENNRVNKSAVASAQKGDSGSSDNPDDAADVAQAVAVMEEDSGVAPVEVSQIEVKLVDTAAADQKPAGQAPVDEGTVAQVHSPDEAINVDAKPEVIAIDKDDLAEDYEDSVLGDMPLVLHTGDDVVAYTPLREGNFEVEGKAEGQSDGDFLYFQLSSQSAHEAISSALAKWESLEDAAAPVEAPVAEIAPNQDGQNQQANGWLL